MKKKRFTICAAIASAIVALASCASTSSGDGGEKKAKGGKMISRSMDGGIVLNNGILKLSMMMDGGKASVCLFDGKDMIKDRTDGKDTFRMDYTMNEGGHSKGYGLKPGKVDIIENTEERAHVAFIDNGSPIKTEYHLIMMAGDSGLYTYIKVKVDRPDLKLAEFRTVYRTDRTLMPNAYNNERHGPNPRMNVMQAGAKIQDETYDMGEDGKQYTNGVSNIYAKYDYASYLKECYMWGTYGDNYGFWVIPASTEYVSGGPMKQDLTVHYDNIVCNYMTSAHIGTAEFAIPEGWNKFFGPWYVYINKGASADEVIADAQKRAKEEQAKWPYKWVSDEDYPVVRGNVTGTLNLNGVAAAGAQVIVAVPGSDVIHDKTGYIFSAVAGEDGSFSVPAVRPGEYQIQAYMQSGSVTDTYISDKITVTDAGLDMGTLDWQVKDGNVLWQIGEADHKSIGFLYSDKLRNYTWQTQVPSSFTYKVGETKDAEFPYVQSKVGDYNIVFDSNGTSTPIDIGAPYKLTVAMAAFSNGYERSSVAGAKPKLVVSINGNELGSFTYDNDQTVYRQGMQSGSYHLEVMDVPAGTIRAGENTVTLHCDGASVMYDTIMLKSSN